MHDVIVVSTESVVAVSCNADNLGAHLCALLWDVTLFDFLRRNETRQGGDDSKLLEEHCNGMK